MVNYYLCITDSTNWEIILNNNIWGVSERHIKIFNDICDNDILLFYETADWNRKKPGYIRGFCKVNGDPHYEGSKLFSANKRHKDELYPFRVMIKEIVVFSEPIEFKNVVDKLSFIQNKEHWALYLRGKAMVSICEDDYELLNEIFDDYI